jgi:hypothetical protein
VSRLGQRAWRRRFAGRSYQPPLPFDVHSERAEWKYPESKQFTTTTSGNTLSNVDWKIAQEYPPPTRVGEIVKADGSKGYVMWDGDEWRSR